MLRSYGILVIEDALISGTCLQNQEIGDHGRAAVELTSLIKALPLKGLLVDLICLVSRISSLGICYGSCFSLAVCIVMTVCKVLLAAC